MKPGGRMIIPVGPESGTQYLEQVVLIHYNKYVWNT